MEKENILFIKRNCFVKGQFCKAASLHQCDDKTALDLAVAQCAEPYVPEKHYWADVPDWYAELQLNDRAVKTVSKRKRKKQE